MIISERPHGTDRSSMAPPGVFGHIIPISAKVPEVKLTNGNGHVAETPEVKPTNGNGLTESGVGNISVAQARRRTQRARFNSGWRRR